MLVDCKLKDGRVERCLIDRDWHGVLEVLFSTYGSHNILWIVDVDNPKNRWFNLTTPNSVVCL